MTKDEWRQLVAHIFRQSIAPRLVRRRLRRFHPFEFFEEYPWDLERLTRAMKAVRFIEDYFDDEDELSEAVTLQFLSNTLDSLADGLKWTDRFVAETKVADAIQSHFDVIVDGMDASDLPDEDFEILRFSGSHDPRSELSLLVDRIKREKEAVVRRHGEAGFSASIREVRERVVKRKEELTSNQAVKKRPFKGLGGIFQGVMLTIVNSTLVIGMWPVPLPVETKTVGAVVSITSGIGSILTGYGEWRGE